MSTAALIRPRLTLRLAAPSDDIGTWRSMIASATVGLLLSWGLGELALWLGGF